MTLTRTQAGKTPKKTEHPGFVQTPGTYRATRSRKSEIRSDESDAMDSTGPEDNTIEVDAGKTTRRKSAKTRLAEAADEHTNGRANGHANGHANGDAKAVTEKKPNLLKAETKDPKIDDSGHFEFGGSWGVSAIMIGFPVLMYYMWVGATYYDGRPPLKQSGESYEQFLRHLGGLIYEGAFPTAKAWAMYWVFFIFQLFLYAYAPGIWSTGKPLPHENGRILDYYCSGLWSWWITIVTALTLHFTGYFRLDTIVDEFGPLMSVAIISGILVSIVLYTSALIRGKQHRMTGYPIYDFFMGAELNPRIGIIDFKMFFEVRLPWYILFLVTLGACARQYEQYGYVSGNMALLLYAHWLYANACAKGEECIVTTWDMYYEKLGFMLAFWNMAGVPLSYCHCTIYLANHDPAEYEWNKYAMTAMFVAYSFVYWVWDTTNSQKNRFRRQETGADVERKAFPQLPWGTIKDPKVIKTANGGTILVDGWYGYARKIHYTCDTFFAISWAAVTGFNSPFPWFYPVFFVAMIIHRAIRDIQKCRRRYGEAWMEYERQVPYLFIPYVI